MNHHSSQLREEAKLSLIKASCVPWALSNLYPGGLGGPSGRIAMFLESSSVWSKTGNLGSGLSSATTSGKSHLISGCHFLNQLSHCISSLIFIRHPLSTYYVSADVYCQVLGYTQRPLGLSPCSLVAGGFLGSMQWDKTYSISRFVGAQRRLWPILLGGLGNVSQKKGNSWVVKMGEWGEEGMKGFWAEG